MNKVEMKTLAQRQEETDLKITYAVAALMLAMHECGKIKHEQGVTQAYVKAVLLIEKNPGWAKRFRQTMKQMSAELDLAKQMEGQETPCDAEKIQPPESVL